MILFILLAGISSCSRTSKFPKIEGQTMGTTYHIKYSQKNIELSSEEVNAKVAELLKNINLSMSTYIKSSEISKFNSDPSLEWRSASKEILKVTSKALSIGELTAGSYDPTIGPLVNLWGFGPNGKRVVPSDDKIQEAMKSVGLSMISLDLDKKLWKKNNAKVYVDLSSLAKGYGVDEVASLLEELGTTDYMVEIGGEVRTSGTKLGHPWKIAIESPDIENPTKSYPKVLSLNNAALATSGNYRNFFTQSNKNYSHTINFKTGSPVAHTLASVSVVNSGSCMDADAWATALMSLGYEEGIKLAEKLKLSAYFIYKLDTQKNFIAKGTTEFNKLFK
ncbi:FAD:protein FMN transferase [Halobacteriovorax sp.]|uniref:FAD:protein FMN transferase n=1 Tax=Halobacteriovorax sp. TaxID=2020862 RepID=UPI0035662767